MTGKSSQSKVDLAAKVWAVFLSIINLAAVLFGCLLLVSAIYDVILSYNATEAAQYGVLIFGGVGLLVIIGLLLPATIFLMPRRYLPFWFQHFLLLMLIVGVIANVAAIGCVFEKSSLRSWVSDMRFRAESPLYTSGLHDALVDGDVERAKTILESNSGLVREKDCHGDTPLEIAIKGGNPDMVKLFISHGADVNDSDFGGTTLLHWAVEKNHVEIARILIENGARVNREDIDKKTPLAYAQSSGNKEMVKLLLAHGGTPMNYKDEAVRAAERGDKKRLEQMLAKGVDVNMVEPTRMTLLHHAAWDGQIETAELLLSKGAKIEAEAATRTPLLCAAYNGQAKMVKFLLAKGANVNAENSSGVTPLHWASREGYIEIVKILLDAGADINAHTDDGESALDMAKERENSEVIELLRKNGAKD